MRALTSGQFPYIVEKLKNLGFATVLTTANPLLPKPVSFHADMQFLKTENNTAFVLKNSNLKVQDYNLIKTKGNPQDKYPKDCLLNCLIINKNVFGNKNSIDENLMNYFCQNNYVFNHVNQGYSRCSCFKLDENHVITADLSLKNALEKCNISVFFIESGGITLPGYDYGFIGGCGGVVSGKAIFTGSLQTHPSGKEIENYIKNLNFEIIQLSSQKLLDIGGILQL